MRRAHPVTRSLFLGDILTGFEGTGWEGVKKGGWKSDKKEKKGELCVITEKKKFKEKNLQLYAIFTIKHKITYCHPSAAFFLLIRVLFYVYA